MVACRRIEGMPHWELADGMVIFRLRTLGSRRHDLESKSLINLLISLSYSLHLMFMLMLRRKDYDIVHFHGASLPLIINTIPLKLIGKKIIAKVAGAKMNIEAGSFRGRYMGLGRLFRRILRHVDVFIAITGEIREDLIQDGILPERIWKT